VTVTSQPPAAEAVSSSARTTAATGLLQLAVLTALAGGVLAGGSYVGNIGLLVAVAVIQAVLIVSWVFGTGLPGRIGALVLAVLAAGGADAAVTHWTTSGYSPVLGVVGVAIPLMFIHQLTRGVVRTRVVESLADITVLIIAVVAFAGLIVLRRQGNGDLVTPAIVAAIAAGLVAGHFTDAVLPAPRFDPAIDRGLPAVVVGIVVGGLIGLLALRRVIDYAGGRGAFIGAAVAAVACLLSIGASFSRVHSSMAGPAADQQADVLAEAASTDERFRIDRLQPVAAVLMTIALTTPAAYVLTNALAG
jgi:hypothetical protein